MALSRTVSLVCVLVAAVCGLTMSQAPGPDQSLFNMMSSQPAAGTGGMTGGMGLDSILNSMGGGNSFASGTGSPAPNPSFPTMGGSGGMMGASQPQNPMSRLLPLLMFSGMDMSKSLMMMLFGGMGGMGGGMGGMGMLPMIGLMNNM